MRRFGAFTVALFVLALAFTAFAQEGPPGPDVDIGESVEGLIRAIDSGAWILVPAFGIMIAVFFVRKYWQRLEKHTKLLPYIAVAVGVLAGAATALIADPGAILDAVVAGIKAGILAAGAWGLLGPARKRLKKE